MLTNDREYVHYPRLERILDIFWVGMFLYILFIGLGTQDRPADADSSTWTSTLVLEYLLVIAMTAAMIARPSRHRVTVVDTTVTYTQFRGLGFIPSKTVSFDISELGLLVLDTERRCDCCHPTGCCLGFLGIYVTKGFPTNERPLEIAFELPIIYNGWTHMTEACSLGCYRDSFSELCRVLGFKYHGKEAVTQQTTVTGGSWAQNQSMTAQALVNDSLASYENKLAVNWSALAPGSYSFERRTMKHKATYILIGQGGTDPNRGPATHQMA